MTEALGSVRSGGGGGSGGGANGNGNGTKRALSTVAAVAEEAAEEEEAEAAEEEEAEAEQFKRPRFAASQQPGGDGELSAVGQGRPHLLCSPRFTSQRL
jgi:hypothetical protein